MQQVSIVTVLFVGFVVPGRGVLASRCQHLLQQVGEVLATKQHGSAYHLKKLCLCLVGVVVSSARVCLTAAAALAAPSQVSSGGAHCNQHRMQAQTGNNKSKGAFLCLPHVRHSHPPFFVLVHQSLASPAQQALAMPQRG